MVPPYAPEPLTDFSQEGNQRLLAAALDEVSGQLGQRYPLIIGGARVETPNTFGSLNPSHPAEVVGYVASGTREHAEAAMTAALEGFERWRRVPPRRARTTPAQGRRRDVPAQVRALGLGGSGGG